jgi:hypothetical protein
MNFKNIITNIFGIFLWISVGINGLSQYPSIAYMISISLLGGVFFLFKNDKLILFFSRVINFKLRK